MPDSPAHLNETLNRYQQRVENALQRWLPPETTQPERLHQAMRYAVLGPGKRLRPALVYATAEALNIDLARVDSAACALEMVHAYSLVHDDLPAMDDDDLRRGRPTCHRQFDEATAILAGDALQALAFDVLARDPMLAHTPEACVSMMQMLAAASGSVGMAGGQSIDLQAQGRGLTESELEQMHRLKTGCLITAAVGMAALADPDTSQTTTAMLHRYAEAIGLAFQIQDDILDVEGCSETLGKQTGADQALNKPNYPSVIGLEASRKCANALADEAIEAIAALPATADTLRALAHHMVARLS